MRLLYRFLPGVCVVLGFVWSAVAVTSTCQLGNGSTNTGYADIDLDSSGTWAHWTVATKQASSSCANQVQDTSAQTHANGVRVRWYASSADRTADQNVLQTDIAGAGWVNGITWCSTFVANWYPYDWAVGTWTNSSTHWSAPTFAFVDSGGGLNYPTNMNAQVLAPGGTWPFAFTNWGATRYPNFIAFDGRANPPSPAAPPIVGATGNSLGQVVGGSGGGVVTTGSVMGQGVTTVGASGGTTNYLTQADMYRVGNVIVDATAGVEAAVYAMATNLGRYLGGTNGGGGGSSSNVWVQNFPTNQLVTDTNTFGLSSNLWELIKTGQTNRDMLLQAMGTNLQAWASNAIWLGTNLSGVRGAVGASNAVAWATNELGAWNVGEGVGSAMMEFASRVSGTGPAPSGWGVVSLGWGSETLDLKRALSWNIVEQTDPIGHGTTGLDMSGTRAWCRMLFLWIMGAGIVLWFFREVRAAYCEVMLVPQFQLSPTASGVAAAVPGVQVGLRTAMLLGLFVIILALPTLAMTLFGTVWFFVSGSASAFSGAVAWLGTTAASIFGGGPPSFWYVGVLINEWFPLLEGLAVVANLVIAQFGIGAAAMTAATWSKAWGL